jgi:hypothetical protein
LDCLGDHSQDCGLDEAPISILPASFFLSPAYVLFFAILAQIALVEELKFRYCSPFIRQRQATGSFANVCDRDTADF